MSRFRKKPVVIDAFQWTGDETQLEDPVWIVEMIKAGTVEISPHESGIYLHIKTLEGEMHASPGDYIIRGIKGEIYPCKPDIFEQSYEMVESESECEANALEFIDLLDVFNAIRGEREYQQALWGPTEMQGKHNVTEFLVYLRDYVEEGLHIQSRIASPGAEDETLPIMRKIAALAVACMEQNGIVVRDMIDLKKKREEHGA